MALDIFLNSAHSDEMDFFYYPDQWHHNLDFGVRYFQVDDVVASHVQEVYLTYRSPRSTLFYHEIGSLHSSHTFDQLHSFWVDTLMAEQSSCHEMMACNLSAAIFHLLYHVFHCDVYQNHFFCHVYHSLWMKNDPI